MTNVDYAGMMERKTPEEVPKEEKYKRPTVQEESLTTRGHIDPDKHWIGESLPSPSDAEATHAGVTSGAGVSPFPARADHSHDYSTYYGVVNGVGMTVAPGQAFINNLTFQFGRNMLAPGSSQILIFPVEGVWEIIYSMYATRSGGGLFRGECNVVFFYNNGTFNREVYRVSLYDVPDHIAITAIDHIHFPVASSLTNIQVAIQHNDTVNWTVITNYLECRRLSSYGTA